MNEFESPSSSWTMTALGDLSEVKSGVGFPKKYQGQSSGDYPVYKVGDVSRSVTQAQGLLGSANHYVNTEEAAALKGVIFRSGSTLFAKIGEAVKLNRRAFVILPGLADNNVMAVVPLLRESDRYLHYFLRTVDLSDVSRSTTVPSVRKGDIEELLVPLPPLDEQKAIAEKLDTLLAQVESTKARLERIPKILKRFRQSVLAAAVSGKLTEEWRDNNEIDFSEWELLTVGDVATVATGKTPSRKEPSYWNDGDIPWLTSASTGDICTRSANQFVTRRAVEECSLKLFEPGTLLLAMYGEGKTRGQVTELMISATCNQACAAVIANEKKTVRSYLKLRLLENYEETRKVAAGGAQPNLNLNKVRTIEINVPSIQEQTEIVRRVDQLFAYADTIETQVSNALERVNNLTQSILAKAFRGELTEQWRKDNSDLISGENSAEALLERIKVERAAAKPVKRGRKKAQ